MRLFVAVEVPAGIKRAIESDVVGPLRSRIPGARWTRPEGRHLTLKFLGNVDDTRVNEIADAVRSVAGRHEPFRASFDEVGGFPNARRPGVLWVGLGEGAEAMALLAGDLERELEPLGFTPENRPFRSHVTIARMPKPQVIKGLSAAIAPEESFEVTEVVLFESRLRPRGAHYLTVDRARLSR